jgi:glycosyltransferase involved in cell wall biosynthesis
MSPDIGSLSVVVPAYNEEEVLPYFYERLAKVMDSLTPRWEVIFVNDGSTDRTLQVIQDLRRRHTSVAYVDLSRNFGKEIALTAGLDHATGDAVIVIDADLQDPPEVIPQLVQGWLEGHDMVYAQRVTRDGETIAKKATASLFYRLLRRISDVPIPVNTGDFRLLSRRAVTALGQLREHHRFMKGLFAWIGFPQKAVPYHRDARRAGQTKWNYWRLWKFGLEGITSFTVTPLTYATYLGLLTAGAAFSYGLWTIYKTIVYGDPVQGYPSLMVVIAFLGGVQLITLGIIGEYLGRIFNESKHRPLYLINSVAGVAVGARFGSSISARVG